jgi:SagB-type dehydrogenase family enzyme
MSPIGAAARAFLSGPHQPPDGLGQVDLNNLPPPYKRYHDASRVRLGARAGTIEVGRMLREINGLTRIRWMTGLRPAGPNRSGGALSPARPVPASGALYPVEMYLVAGGTTELDAGLYHYDPVHHALDLLREGDGRSEVHSYLSGDPGPPGDWVLLLSTVFWRNAAKYGEFGYRLQNLDVGVVVAQALAVARARGFTASVHLRFQDDKIDDALGLDGFAESVVAVVVLRRGEQAATGPGWGPLLATVDGQPAAITTLPGLAHMAELHTRSRSSETVTPTPRVDSPPERTDLTPLPAGDVDLCSGMARRRTVYGYAPVQVALGRLGGILRAAHEPAPGDLPGAVGPDVVVAVRTVDGLTAGSYRYVPERAGLSALREGDLTRDLTAAAKSMMLADELRGAAVTFLVTADFEPGLGAHGDRWYRMCVIRAGVLAQRICLGASASGLDSHVHCDFDSELLGSALGLGSSRQQPIVLVTLGRAAGNRADPQGSL